MVYVFNSTEENLLDYTLPEGVETFQVRAKLFYSDGSPVVDMNGNEVTHVVSDVIRGTAPSVSASGVQEADSLTVGDTASITIDSTTGTPTPNVNYLWKVDDVSQINSTNTFDTTGLSGGETLTCTVTASNGVSPDATANVNFGTVAAAFNWRVDALCGAKSGDTKMELTSVVESGETENFTVYAFNPVRQIGYTYIEFMVTVESSGAFADAATFVSSTSNRTYSLSVDGVSYNFETVTEVTSGALLRVEMRHSTSTVVQTFWDDLDSGDALVFTVTYA